MTHELDTIYLYGEFPITPRKNAVVNGHTDESLYLQYLENYEHKHILNNFPRIDIAMKITLNININDLSDEDGDFLLENIDAINYLRIEQKQYWKDEVNPRESNYYYFIDNSYFSSDSTLTIECSLDTLQSFWFRFKDSMNVKTYVEREHCNRFIKDGNVITPLYNPTLENIEVEKTFTEVKDDFTLNEGDEAKNYLAYRINENIVYGEYYTDNNLTKLGIYYATWIGQYISDEKRFLVFEGTFVAKREDGVIEIVMRSNENTYIEVRDFRNLTGMTDGRSVRVYLRDKNTGIILASKVMDNQVGLYVNAYYTINFHEPTTQRRFFYYLTSTLDTQGHELSTNQAIFSRIQNNTDFTWTRKMVATEYRWTTPIKCKPTSNLDLTDVSLIKVLDVPYIDLTQLEVISTSDGETRFFLFDSPVIKRTSTTHFIPPSLSTNVEIGMPRIYRIDPKIQTSQFTNYYFVYDEAKIEYKIENSYSLELPIEFTIYYSNNLGSAMMIYVDIAMREEEFMEKYVAVNRDNSVPLVNSEYLNYIRNGYEYDMRNLKTEQGKSVTNFLISTIGAIASFGAGAVTGGVTTAMGVGMSVNALNSIVNLSHNKSQGLAKINQQLKKAQQVAPSIRGTSVDLLRKSGNQKIHNIKVEPSEEDKNRLETYFHFFGYASKKFKIPNIESRYYFNYLKGIVDFSFEGFGLKIKSEVINDIVSRFENGVTIMHLHNDEFFDYDLWFNYENWETNLL